MKRAALAVAVLVAVIAAILLMSRGDDDAPVAVDRDVERVVASGTVARTAPERRRRAPETAAVAKAEDAVARRIEGAVVESATWKPLADADVLVSRRRGPPPRGEVVDLERPGDPEFRAKTSADGTFGVAVPDAGPWTVVGRAKDHADAVALSECREPLRLELAATAESVVTVVAAKNDAPIPGAEVWVFAPGWKGVPQAIAVADERGVAHLRVPQRDASFVVRAKGFVPTFDSSLDAKVRLSTGYRVAGVVRDDAGHGIAGAQLRSELPDRRAWFTDADGKFVLDDTMVWNDNVCPVEATADGFAPWGGQLISGDTDAVIELTRASRVSGIVLLPDGTPAADAVVDGMGKTKTDGAFRLSLGAGPQTIRAEWKPAKGGVFDALFGAARVDVPDGGSLDRVEIRLAPSAKSFVILRIVDGARRPVVDVQAFVVGAGNAGREVRGDLVVLGVDKPAGVDVAVTVADYRSEGLRWSDVHATATTRASVDSAATEIILAPRREFTVDVLGPDGNELPATAMPKLQLGEEWSFRRVAMVRETRASATWTVDPTQKYVLTLEAANFAKLRRDVTSEEIAAGQATVRLHRGAVVHGRVVSPDARAAAGARVSLGSVVRGGSAIGSGDAVRGADGAFRFEHVAPGAWRLLVYWPQTVVVEREVDVGAVADFDVGDVVIPPAATLHGVVSRPDGRPCGGATVQYVLGDDDTHTSPKVVTHEDGAFEIDVPSAAGGALVVARRGFGGVVVRLGGVDPTKALAVRLAPEGKLDVRIRLPKPPALSWSLHVLASDGAVRRQPEDTARMDDKLGFDERDVVSGLGPGAVVVEISSTQWTFIATVSVVAGATTVVVVGPDK